MSILKAIKKRYSCRDYEDRQVEDEKLESILEAAQLAPSAHNSQPYKLVVVKDKKLRHQVAKASGQPFVGEASVIMAGVSLKPDEAMSCGVPTYAVDVAIVLEHVALQAADLGLGTCWVGAFKQEKVKEILDLPESSKVVALMPLGYPADSKPARDRKNLDQLVEIKQLNE